MPFKGSKGTMDGKKGELSLHETLKVNKKSIARIICKKEKIKFVPSRKPTAVMVKKRRKPVLKLVHYSGKTKLSHW